MEDLGFPVVRWIKSRFFCLSTVSAQSYSSFLQQCVLTYGPWEALKYKTETFAKFGKETLGLGKTEQANSSKTERCKLVVSENVGVDAYLVGLRNE